MIHARKTPCFCAHLDSGTTLSNSRREIIESTKEKPTVPSCFCPERSVTPPVAKTGLLSFEVVQDVEDPSLL